MVRFHFSPHLPTLPTKGRRPSRIPLVKESISLGAQLGRPQGREGAVESRHRGPSRLAFGRKFGPNRNLPGRQRRNEIPHEGRQRAGRHVRGERVQRRLAKPLDPILVDQPQQPRAPVREFARRVEQRPPKRHPHVDRLDPRKARQFWLEFRLHGRVILSAAWFRTHRGHFSLAPG